MTSLSADSDYLAASVFFVLVVWGFVTSGDKLTGPKANTVGYPRDGRILLTVAYTLISDASLLYLGALRVPCSSLPALSYLTADLVTRVGLERIGFRSRHRRLRRRGTAEPAGWLGVPALAGAAPGRARARRAPARSLSAAQVAVAGIGARGHRSGPGDPRQCASPAGSRGCGNAQNHLLAPVPGPGCDAGRQRRGHDVLSGGTLWSVTPGEPITTQCGPAGLRVEIAPGRSGEGDVEFLPPDGFASRTTASRSR